MNENMPAGKAQIQAIDLGTKILQICRESEPDPNIAQAALGSSWFRLCFAMGFPPHEFDALLSELSLEYHEQFKIKS